MVTLSEPGPYENILRNEYLHQIGEGNYIHGAIYIYSRHLISRFVLVSYVHLLLLQMKYYTSFSVSSVIGS